MLEALDVKGPLVGFEVFVERPPWPKSQGSTNRGRMIVSDKPAVERDFAFLVAADCAAGDIQRAARGAEKKLISEVVVFDVYQGPGVAEGQKSVAISVRLEPDDRTLTEAEIDAVAAKIIGAVEKRTGGRLRG